MVVYNRAMDSLRSGKFDESLDDFKWLQAHALEHGAHFQSLRRTYALAGWVELARLFAPAKQALEDLLTLRAQEHAQFPSDVEKAKDLFALEERIQRLRTP